MVLDEAKATVDDAKLAEREAEKRNEALDGLAVPPPFALAHTLVRSWVEEGGRVLDI